MTRPSPMPPPGWYPDPGQAGSGQLRYFDGNHWTDYCEPAYQPQLPPVASGPIAPAVSGSPAASAASTEELRFHMPPPASKAYLMSSPDYPRRWKTPSSDDFWCEVTLELTDTHLRCTINKYDDRLERALGIRDLRARLSAGQPVAAFVFRRDALQTVWIQPLYVGHFYVREGQSSWWEISFDGRLIGEAHTGCANQWQQALPGARW